MERSLKGPTRVLLHPRFIGAGATLFIAAFATDAMYCETSVWQWANFSAWLITIGLVVALVATIVLVIDFLTARAARLQWIPFLLVAGAALLSLINALIHSRDAWTSVVPQGVMLSAVVTVLLLIAALRGWRVSTAQDAALGDRA